MRYLCLWKLHFQAYDWKKFWKLTAELERAYFSDIALKKKVRSTEFRIFEVKDHKRLVLNTIFCCFWEFVTFSITLLVCKSNFRNMHITETSHTCPSVPEIVLILIFSIFRHTNWPNNTQYWLKKGIIMYHYVKLTKAYWSLGVACLIKKA